MLKRLTLLISLFWVVPSTVIIAGMREIPTSFTLDMKSLVGVDRKTMIPVDEQQLLYEDSVRIADVEVPTPFRFGVAIDVSLNLDNSGTWEILPDSSELWRLNIVSNNAKSINLAFTQFDLPEGAKLWLYSASGDYVEGPYTSFHRNPDGQLWTPIILSDDIVVELVIPQGMRTQTNIEIGKVNHGYRGFWPTEKSNWDKSGACNIDAVCPAGNPWRDQIRSAAFYSINGVDMCSGQLLNNTNQDFTPYFLTANHCGITSGNAGTIVVYWNFESPACGDHGGGSKADNQAGAVLRANWATSDFALIELQNDPDDDFNVFFSGWDNSGTTPSSAVCIHHPSCDEKSITFNNDPLTSYMSDTHWYISEWEAGTTEPGSSGSGLWVPATGLLIGQLHGGLASCTAPDEYDYFGKFSSSWGGGGTAATRLRDWLNPADDGTTQLEGNEPAITGGPAMRIQSVILDYGDVELGFAFTKAIIIYNDGNATLTVSVVNQFPGDPDLLHWSDVNEITNHNIPMGGSPLMLTQVYEPQALGNHDLNFLVTSNDTDYPSQGILLVGDGVAPSPLYSVLVLDRSGSMRETAGERRKIDAMRDAADLYTHLLRPDIGGSGTGDKIGFVKYNKYNSIYLPLDFVDDVSAPGSHLADAETKLSDAALADASRLKPNGRTGIGGAMQTAAGMFTVPEPDLRHVMVVLTDGIENEDPYIEHVIGPIQTADADLQMYSVGVGTNIEPNKLQSITNVGNGYHQVADDLSGENLFDLETFYFKIFANASGMDLVVDPTYAVPILDSLPIPVSTATITSSDRKAYFLVLDDPDLRRFYDLELVAPNGQVIGPSTIIGGIAVHVMQRYTYTIYKVVLPDPNTTTDYVGNWVLRLNPKGTVNRSTIRYLINEKSNLAAYREIDPRQGNIPVGFAAAVSSNYRMLVDVIPSNYDPGASVLLTARITDRGWPVTDAGVSVDVTSSWGDIVQTITLNDNGIKGDYIAGDGIWSGRFTQTHDADNYKFIFRSNGRNNVGESANREASQFLTLGIPPRPPKWLWSASLHGGTAIPTGNFADAYDPGINFLVDAGYRFNQNLAVMGFIGYNDFKSKFAGVDDNYIINLSLNARYYQPYRLLPMPPWSYYVGAGLGIYIPQDGDTEFGFNVGAGIDYEINSNIIFEVGADYHRTFDDIEFIHAHGGVIYRF